MASPATPVTLKDYAEDALFKHYLDRTFYVQYPFYRALAGQGQGWLLSVVGQDKPAYYATLLALSKCHLLSTSPCKSKSVVDADGSNYEKAMRAMQDYMNELPSWNANDRLSRSLYGLASIKQLLFYRVSRSAATSFLTHSTNTCPGLYRLHTRLAPPISASQHPATWSSTGAPS